MVRREMRVEFTLRDDEPLGFRENGVIYINLYWIGYDTDDILEWILSTEIHEWIHEFSGIEDEEVVEEIERKVLMWILNNSSGD